MADVTLKGPQSPVGYGDKSYTADGSGLVRVPSEAAGHLVAKGGFTVVDPKVALISSLANRISDIVLSDVTVSDPHDELVASQCAQIAALETAVGVRMRDIKVRSAKPEDRQRAFAAEPDPREVLIDAHNKRIEELRAQLHDNPLPTEEPARPSGQATAAGRVPRSDPIQKIDPDSGPFVKTPDPAMTDASAGERKAEETKR